MFNSFNSFGTQKTEMLRALLFSVSKSNVCAGHDEIETCPQHNFIIDIDILIPKNDYSCVILKPFVKTMQGFGCFAD